MRYIILCFSTVFISLGALATSAQEVAPVPPPRPENLGVSTPSPQNQNQNLNQPEIEQPSETTPAPIYEGPNQPLSLVARAGENGKIISRGLQWRIYSVVPDQDGNLKLLARSTESTPTFSLPTGPYIAHLSFGRAQSSDTITVEEGPNQREMILEVGGLELNAAIRGDIAIPNRWLRFTVYSDAAAPGGRKIIAQAVEPGRTLYLNSGTYSVTSHFGDINATAKADIEVVTGERTAAILYHNAAIITFKLVSEPGGEAIADTSWIIKNRDGDILFEEKNTFPQTVLEKGEYVLIAKLGSRVFNREFEVVPGLPREIEVISSLGTKSN